jgi:plastocyanin
MRATIARRRALAALLGCAAALALWTGTAAGGPAPLGPQSEITARVYLPAAITVAAGQTIGWHNETLGPHTVTSTTELFNSGRLDGGTSYSLKFDAPGTFDYYCTVHPTMKGVVTVLAIPPEKILLHVHEHHSAAAVRVQVARAGVRALLQAAPAGRARGPFKTLARADLSAQGTASFSLGAGHARRIRVLVPAAYGQPRLLSRSISLP